MSACDQSFFLTIPLIIIAILICMINYLLSDVFFRKATTLISFDQGNILLIMKFFAVNASLLQKLRIIYASHTFLIKAIFSMPNRIKLAIGRS